MISTANRPAHIPALRVQASCAGIRARNARVLNKLPNSPLGKRATTSSILSSFFHSITDCLQNIVVPLQTPGTTPPFAMLQIRLANRKPKLQNLGKLVSARTVVARSFPS